MSSQNSYIALTSKNIQQNELNLNEYITIDKSIADTFLLRSKIYKNDIVLSYTGEYRRALVMLENNFQLGPNICRIRPLSADNVNSFYLSVFLNSKYGQQLLDREKTLSAQPTVAMSRIRRLPIPILNSEIQQSITSKYLRAEELRKESFSKYKEAEDLLYKALMMDQFRISDNNTSVKSLKNSFEKSGRLDAEYYQSKYDELFEMLSKVDCNLIKEIKVTNYRGFQPKYVDNGKIDVINSKHILEYGLDYENFEKTDEISYNEVERSHVKYGDILTYTTGANIGRTQVFLSYRKAIASNHVNMLRVKNVNPIYLALVLNSTIGRMQTERVCTGSAQAELYPDDIENFIVPILSPHIQEEIASLVLESYDSKKQSKLLLQEAKRMVEVEIECHINRRLTTDG